MRHPKQAALALHAGGDLGAFARWRMERHLAHCARCREEVAAFQSVRNSMADLGELPELPWSLLAAEMRANIRLGLSAGECVRAAENKSRFANAPLHLGWRSFAAMATIAALAVTGIILEHPHPRVSREENAALQTAPDGIGSQAMRLMYRGAEGVQISASAGGSVEARYTDPNTLYMTVSEVDAQ
jgi:anti-sigma factor RsiW